VTDVALRSERFSVDDSFEAVNQLLYDQGCTDGLPVVPPTEPRIVAMLHGTRRPSDETLGALDPLKGEATVEKIAINAVMAGCLPEYMPVLIAAVEALIEPEFNAYTMQATTSPVGPMLVLNGPIRHQLDVNCGASCMGPGRRANATLGRAIRLILLNIGGGIPGLIDKATHGQPAKYTFCFGENEEESPWEPFHVEYGFAPDQSTVAVFAVHGDADMLDIVTQRGDAMLRCFAQTVNGVSLHNTQRPFEAPMIVFSPEHAGIVARSGFSKAEAKGYLYEHSGVPLAHFSEEMQHGRIERWGWAKDGVVRPAPGPEGPKSFRILVAGGVGPHSEYISCTSQAIRPIGD